MGMAAKAAPIRGMPERAPCRGPPNPSSALSGALIAPAIPLNGAVRARPACVPKFSAFLSALSMPLWKSSTLATTLAAIVPTLFSAMAMPSLHRAGTDGSVVYLDPATPLGHDRLDVLDRPLDRQGGEYVRRLDWPASAVRVAVDDCADEDGNPQIVAQAAGRLQLVEGELLAQLHRIQFPEQDVDVKTSDRPRQPDQAAALGVGAEFFSCCSSSAVNMQLSLRARS